MALRTESNSRERILMMGSWGTGKSEAWCAIAKWLEQTKAEGKLYVLDTDNAVDRLIEGQSYENKVIPYDLLEWQDYKAAIAEARDKGTRDDWLILDMADKPWEEVQNYYIEQAFDKDAAEFFLQWKTDNGKGSPLAGEYGANWQVINKLYSSFIGKVARFPGHVLACTPVDQVNKEQEKNKEILDTYGRFGVKPRGQKALGHQFHTILLTLNKGKDQYAYTTVKDRKRAQLSNEPVVDFVTSYLVKVAGWKL